MNRMFLTLLLLILLTKQSEKQYSMNDTGFYILDNSETIENITFGTKMKVRNVDLACLSNFMILTKDDFFEYFIIEIKRQKENQQIIKHYTCIIESCIKIFDKYLGINNKLSSICQKIKCSQIIGFVETFALNYSAANPFYDLNIDDKKNYEGSQLNKSLKKKYSYNLIYVGSYHLCMMINLASNKKLDNIFFDLLRKLNFCLKMEKNSKYAHILMSRNKRDFRKYLDTIKRIEKVKYISSELENSLTKEQYIKDGLKKNIFIDINADDDIINVFYKYQIFFVRYYKIQYQDFISFNESMNTVIEKRKIVYSELFFLEHEHNIYMVFTQDLPDQFIKYATHFQQYMNYHQDSISCLSRLFLKLGKIESKSQAEINDIKDHYVMHMRRLRYIKSTDREKTIKYIDDLISEIYMQISKTFEKYQYDIIKQMNKYKIILTYIVAQADYQCLLVDLHEFIDAHALILTYCKSTKLLRKELAEIHDLLRTYKFKIFQNVINQLEIKYDLLISIELHDEIIMQHHSLIVMTLIYIENIKTTTYRIIEVLDGLKKLFDTRLTFFYLIKALDSFQNDQNNNLGEILNHMNSNLFQEEKKSNEKLRATENFEQSFWIYKTKLCDNIVNYILSYFENHFTLLMDEHVTEKPYISQTTSIINIISCKISSDNNDGSF